MARRKKKISPVVDNSSSDLPSRTGDDPACSQSGADDDPPEQSQTKRHRLPSHCPHCHGSLQDDIDTLDLLKSTLAGQDFQSLNKTIDCALLALPAHLRYLVPTEAIAALLKMPNPRPYDKAVIAQIEIPVELRGGQEEIARMYFVEADVISKRAKFFRCEAARFLVERLDAYLHQEQKEEHRKNLRAVIRFLPEI
jgi:hypothetical protein